MLSIRLTGTSNRQHKTELGPKTTPDHAVYECMRTTKYQMESAATCNREESGLELCPLRLLEICSSYDLRDKFIVHVASPRQNIGHFCRKWKSDFEQYEMARCNGNGSLSMIL